LALALFILGIVLVGALALRLSQGPLEIAWIAHRLEAALTADGPTRLTIGHAELAWEGWRLGLDRPLDLRLADIAAVDPNGTVIARLPRAELSVSAGSLLLGRIVPRAVEIDGARLRASRAADGTVALDLGSLTDAKDANSDADADLAADIGGPGGLSEILRALTRPPQGDASVQNGSVQNGIAQRGGPASRWAQLRRVRIRDAAVVVVDRQLGIIWRAPQLDLDLRRRFQGGVEGEGHADIWLGGQTLGLSLRATLQDAHTGGGEAASSTTNVQAELTPFVPARFAAVSPLLASLSALDARVSLSATTTLGANLMPSDATLRAHVDAGRARINDSAVAFLGADLDARIGGGQAVATLTRLDLMPRPDGPPTKVTGGVTARRDGDRYALAVEVAADQLAFADLGAVWPQGVVSGGARPWLTKNITAGTVHDAHVSIGLSLPRTLDDASLTSLSGGLTGQDITLHWLRPVPPIEHGDARLVIAGPDVIDIAVTAGRQGGGSQGGIALKAGKVHITGLTVKDQYADIDADLAGPLADLIALLRNPKIRILDKRPIEMRNPAGRLAGKLTIDHLFLDERLTLEDLKIHTTTHLTDVHLGGVAAGRDLDRGVLDLDAGNDGLHVKGTAQVASIPSQLSVDMDFRDGPPTQVITKVGIAGTADEKALAGLGLDAAGFLAGPVGIKASLAQRRDGRGDAAVHLDLDRAALTQARMGLRKAAGAPATGDVQIVLDHDRIASIERVVLLGDGIEVRGAADMAGGRPNVLRLQRVHLGSATDLHGEVGLPQKPGDPYRVDLQGPSIDLSGEFARSGKAGAKAERDERPGPPYLVDLKFDRVLVGNGISFAGVSAHAENDGSILRRARFAGRTAAAAPFSIAIEPDGAGRRLEGSAADMGALLRGLDVADDIASGRMSVAGTYNDRAAGHPLSGRLEVEEFRVHGAPALGKILQAMTLYGLVDAMSGPGLNFDKLVTPFRYSNDVLELSDARAFSSSLGMTAKGRVDLGRRSMDLRGTVVPAYFFNSLLGGIPLVGRIFSPEQGGGLFAVTYSVRGPFDNPSVGVNPLSALTPGFLRGIFGVFDAPKR
jgi:hypothetical protein